MDKMEAADQVEEQSERSGTNYYLPPVDIIDEYARTHDMTPASAIFEILRATNAEDPTPEQLELLQEVGMLDPEVTD